MGMDLKPLSTFRLLGIMERRKTLFVVTSPALRPILSTPSHPAQCPGQEAKARLFCRWENYTFILQYEKK